MRCGSAQASGPLTPATPVTLTWDNGQGVVFKRTISVDDDYMFKLVDDGREPLGCRDHRSTPYARIHRYGTPKIENNWILHEGLIGVIGAQGEQRSKYATALEEPLAHVRDRRPAAGSASPTSTGRRRSSPIRRRPYRATLLGAGSRSCRASSRRTRPTTCATRSRWRRARRRASSRSCSPAPSR